MPNPSPCLSQVACCFCRSRLLSWLFIPVNCPACFEAWNWAKELATQLSQILFSMVQEFRIAKSAIQRIATASCQPEVQCFWRGRDPETAMFTHARKSAGVGAPPDSPARYPSQTINSQPQTRHQSQTERGRMNLQSPFTAPVTSTERSSCGKSHPVGVIFLTSRRNEIRAMPQIRLMLTRRVGPARASQLRFHSLVVTTDAG